MWNYVGEKWPVNLARRCPKMPDFHIAFKDLLHDVNLQYGTQSFTSLLKEGVLRIFFSP
jgi:hypothetical protein